MLSIFSQSLRCYAFVRVLSAPTRLYSYSKSPTESNDPFVGKMQRKTEEELASLVDRVANSSSVESNANGNQAEKEEEEEMVNVRLSADWH